MSNTPPPLSSEQRRAALEKAAEARRVRADVKAKLKSGELSLDALFQEAEREPMVAKLKVRTALESLPGLGKVHARRLMIELEIADSRRVKGLGPRQREGLLRHPKICS
ncbi:MAG: integration host factor, actinobacterial type [Acidimicrobiia bacterium]